MADCYFHPCIPTAELPDNSQGVSVFFLGGGSCIIMGKAWGKFIGFGGSFPCTSPDSG